MNRCRRPRFRRLGARRHRFPTHHSDDLSAVLRRPARSADRVDATYGAKRGEASQIGANGDQRFRRCTYTAAPAPTIAETGAVGRKLSAGTVSDRAMGRGVDVDSEGHRRRRTDPHSPWLQILISQPIPMRSDPAGRRGHRFACPSGTRRLRCRPEADRSAMAAWRDRRHPRGDQLRRAVRHRRSPRDHLVARTAHPGRIHRGHADMGGLRRRARRRSGASFGVDGGCRDLNSLPGGGLG